MGASLDTLVVGPAWVGDMVMAQSLFMTLKAQEPSAAIDVVAPAWSAPLLARMPQIRAAHALSAGHGQFHFGARRALGRQLRAAKFARAVVLPRSFKAALVPFFANIPQRIGYLGEWRYGLLNAHRALDKTRLPTTVSRYVALAHPPGLPAPSCPAPQLDHDAAAARALVERLELDTSKKVVALLPGAEYGPAKQWPAEYFAQLATRLVESDCSVWVLGSQKEHALGETIAAHAGVRNLCGRTSLTDAIDLLHLADTAVSNDSGLMHVAAACNATVIALYGSSSPDFTPPLTDHAQIMQQPQPCSPCFARTCRYHHYRCLRDITVVSVAEAALNPAR